MITTDIKVHLGSDSHPMGFIPNTKDAVHQSARPSYNMMRNIDAATTSEVSAQEHHRLVHFLPFAIARLEEYGRNMGTGTNVMSVPSMYFVLFKKAKWKLGS